MKKVVILLVFCPLLVDADHEDPNCACCLKQVLEGGFGSFGDPCEEYFYLEYLPFYRNICVFYIQNVFTVNFHASNIWNSVESNNSPSAQPSHTPCLPGTFRLATRPSQRIKGSEVMLSCRIEKVHHKIGMNRRKVSWRHPFHHPKLQGKGKKNCDKSGAPTSESELSLQKKSSKNQSCGALWSLMQEADPIWIPNATLMAKATVPQHLGATETIPMSHIFLDTVDCLMAYCRRQVPGHVYPLAAKT